MADDPEVRRPDDEVEEDATQSGRSQRDLDRHDDQGGDGEAAGSVAQREAVASDEGDAFDR